MRVCIIYSKFPSTILSRSDDAYSFYSSIFNFICEIHICITLISWKNRHFVTNKQNVICWCAFLRNILILIRSNNNKSYQIINYVIRVTMLDNVSRIFFISNFLFFYYFLRIYKNFTITHINQTAAFIVPWYHCLLIKIIKCQALQRKMYNMYILIALLL